MANIWDQFEDVDVSEELDNPDAIKPGTYSAEITKHEVGPTKAGDKIGLSLHIAISDRDGSEASEKYNGRQLRMWQQLVTKDVAEAAAAGNTQAERTKYYFQQLMTNLGFTRDDLRSINEELFERLDDLPVTVVVGAPQEGSTFPQIKSINVDKGDFDNFDV